MRIVVLDGHSVNPGDNPWDPIGRLGELTVNEHTRDDQVLEQSRGFEIIVTNKAQVTGEVINSLPRIRFITILATGYNIVDVAAAAKRGIPVANVPEYSTDSVAQFTFALLLELCHHVGLHADVVRAGEWVRSRDFSFWKTPLIELAGKTMGIVGHGRIGKRVGELARAFGMNVISYSPSKPGVSLEQLFAESDVVSLHCPLTPSNRGMVNKALLSRMKPSAFFINTARGQLVNETALADALNAGKLAGAAVDVVSSEPMRPDNPLLGAKNILITPHIAWAALESRKRVTQVTADNIAAFLAGKPINVVNANL